MTINLALVVSVLTRNWPEQAESRKEEGWIDGWLEGARGNGRVYKDMYRVPLQSGIIYSTTMHRPCHLGRGRIMQNNAVPYDDTYSSPLEPFPVTLSWLPFRCAHK